MSIRVSKLVWPMRGLTTAQKFVLLKLADHAHHDGTGAYPSIQTICDETALARRTVQLSLRHLEKEGHIRHAGTRRNGNREWLVLPRIFDPEGGKGVSLSSLDGSSGDGLGAPDAPPGGAPDAPPRKPCTPERPENAPLDGAGDAPQRNRYPAQFEELWQQHPRKTGKGDALRAWKTTAKRRPAFEELLSRHKRLACSHDWTKEGGQFAPGLGKWLRGDGWEDEPAATKMAPRSYVQDPDDPYDVGETFVNTGGE